MPAMHCVARLALLVLVCLLGACTDDRAGALTVSPSSVLTAVGRTTTVTAASGDSLANLTWTSSEVSIATVTGHGASAMITGVSPGMVTIRAQLGDRSASVEVAVLGTVVERIDVTAARAVLEQGGTEQLTARAVKTYDTREDVTQTATWTSRDPDVGSVDDHGQIKVLGTGATTISATREGVTGPIETMTSSLGVQGGPRGPP